MAPSTSRLLIFSFPPVLINLVLFFLVLAQAQPDFRYSGCMNDYGNYTANSTYQNNLNLLLSSLPSNASSNNGFYGASAGQNSSRVSAIALCRGDVSSDGCRSCITNSAIKLLQLCPTQVEAMGGYDECMLRYSNRSILGGVSEVSPAFLLWNPNNFSVNATEFNDKLGEMMGRLQQRAAFGHTVRKYFATEIVNLTSFQKLYGLVQCTPDLANAACSSCIETAVSQIPACCDGKQGGRVVMPSCNIRYESAPFYDSTSAPAPPPSPSNNSFSPPSVDNPATNSSTGDGSNTTRTVIIAVVATVFVFLVVLIGCVLRRKKPREKLETTHNVDDITSVESLHVDFDTIRIATDNFSEENKLGQGGFGAVYKGKLVSGKEIAVKRLSMGSRQGDLEFKNEAMLVAKLQHRNLVRLLGFSLKGDERLLIYEYVPNMSLDHFIFDPAKRLLLDFDRRHKIIQGIARGLLYLHEDSRLRIIHRDLKAGNILLDEEMNPKIADFGTARLFVMDQTQGNTSRPMGTYGYMAPEYVLQGRFSVKSDVFSFGVLVLEIVSGQKSNCFRIGGTLVDLLAHAWRSWREGTALNLVDPSLRDGSCTEMMRCVHVGLLCVQENIADRPTMAAVVTMLSTDSVTLPMPSQPAFFMHSRTGSCTISSQESSGGTVSDHSYHKSEKNSLDDEAAASGSDLYPWLSRDF